MVEENKWDALTTTPGCQLGTMPFTYLGLTPRYHQTYSSRLSAYLRMDKHLKGISRHLTYGGRLILVNSVFSVIPTFYLCCLKVPIQIIDQVDSRRKHVLWHGGDLTKRKEVT